eukprot:1039060-Prymnesium_polylepis.1
MSRVSHHAHLAKKVARAERRRLQERLAALRTHRAADNGQRVGSPRARDAAAGDAIAGDTTATGCDSNGMQQQRDTTANGIQRAASPVGAARSPQSAHPLAALKPLAFHTPRTSAFHTPRARFTPAFSNPLRFVPLRARPRCVRRRSPCAHAARLPVGRHSEHHLNVA